MRACEQPSSPQSGSQCPSPSSSVSGDSERKCNTLSMDRSKRLKASARERKRRHVLNDALENLRRRVPCVNQNPQKLSKIEVLRLAIDYIAMLSYYLHSTSPSNAYDFTGVGSQEAELSTIYSQNPYWWYRPQYSPQSPHNLVEQLQQRTVSLSSATFLFSDC